MSRRAEKRRARAVTPAFLRSWPLPKPAPNSDKNSRGTILVAGGSALVPGGLILAGLASLRAGAGKLQLAAPRSVATPVSIAVMEALVSPLSESRGGSPGKAAGREMRTLDDSADAILIGPGMIGESDAAAFTSMYLADAPERPLVIDAACLGKLKMSRPLGPNVVLTPHAGEMSAMLGISKEKVEGSLQQCALEVSAKLGAVVVMKSSTTFIATPSDLFRYDAGAVGLATSGSGDVLAGIIAGLLARGIPTDQAAVWGVAIHGAAGNALARRVAPIGFLARELLDEIPRAMARAAGR
ncbi:MAG: NAD(P)H-hydrate dehydratase [Gemmatimonadota bacterium]|nr:NAD(P)H-hydrate dehydratase [Gemmatimonadota bacterium]